MYIYSENLLIPTVDELVRGLLVCAGNRITRVCQRITRLVLHITSKSGTQRTLHIRLLSCNGKGR